MKNTLTRIHVRKLWIFACIVILAIALVGCRMPRDTTDREVPTLAEGDSAVFLFGSAQQFILVFSEPVRLTNPTAAPGAIDLELLTDSGSTSSTRPAKTVVSIQAITNDGNILSDGRALSENFILRVNPALSAGDYRIRLEENFVQDEAGNQLVAVSRNFNFDANRIRTLIGALSTDRTTLTLELSAPIQPPAVATLASIAAQIGIRNTSNNMLVTGTRIEIGTLSGNSGDIILNDMGVEQRMFTADSNNNTGPALRFIFTPALAEGVDYNVVVPANTFASPNSSVTGLNMEIRDVIEVPDAMSSGN